MESSRAQKLSPINSLQVCRGIAALSVVLYHTNITFALPHYIGRDIFPVFNAGFSGVEFFFVLSGFIIFYAHSRDIGHRERLGRYALRRVTRVLPPLWISLLLVLLTFTLLPKSVPSSAFGLDVLITDFFLLPASQNVLLAVEWTLRYEAIFYIVFATFLLGPAVGSAISIVWLALSVLGTFVALPFPLSQLFTVYNFLFLFGFCAFVAGQRIPPRLGAILIIAGALIFAGTWGQAVLRYIVIDASAQVICFGVGASLLVTGLFSVERASMLPRPPAALFFVGEASYSIYLVHFPIVSALCKIMVLLRERIWFPDALAFTGVFIGATVGGVVFHLLCERPVTALIRKHLRA